MGTVRAGVSGRGRVRAGSGNAEDGVAGGDWITIDERFCGPPRSGNGGYVCGLVAARLEGPVAVRLKAPPPIARPLRIETSMRAARLLEGDALIAEAQQRPLALEAPPPPPGLADAQRASRRFAGFSNHNFPTCFVCGPQRAAGDGLRIFPGPLAEPDAGGPSDSGGQAATPGSTPILAAVWTPDASLADAAGRVRAEFVWAALDCPGAFVRYPPPDGVAVVLGELAVEQTAPVEVGETCIVTAWSLGGEGRKRRAGSALFDAGGRLRARAEAIWVEVAAQGWR